MANKMDEYMEWLGTSPTGYVEWKSVSLTPAEIDMLRRVVDEAGIPVIGLTKRLKAVTYGEWRRARNLLNLVHTAQATSITDKIDSWLRDEIEKAGFTGVDALLEFAARSNDEPVFRPEGVVMDDATRAAIGTWKTNVMSAEQARECRDMILGAGGIETQEAPQAVQDAPEAEPERPSLRNRLRARSWAVVEHLEATVVAMHSARHLIEAAVCRRVGLDDWAELAESMAESERLAALRLIDNIGRTP